MQIFHSKILCQGFVKHRSFFPLHFTSLFICSYIGVGVRSMDFKPKLYGCWVYSVHSVHYFMSVVFEQTTDTKQYVVEIFYIE